MEILDAGGYTRYDFSTATNLLAITDELTRHYAGDLNVLHDRARDPQDLADRIRRLGKGIGEVTANIFLRELRTVWTKARPDLSPLVLLPAGNLGLIPRTQDPLKSLERFWFRRKTQGYDFRDSRRPFCGSGRITAGNPDAARVPRTISAGIDHALVELYSPRGQVNPGLGDCNRIYIGM